MKMGKPKGRNIDVFESRAVELERAMRAAARQHQDKAGGMWEEQYLCALMFLLDSHISQMDPAFRWTAKFLAVRAIMRIPEA
jgi:hypothetical protein